MTAASFRDSVWICASCGVKFVETSMARAARQHEMDRPTRCPACVALDALTGERYGAVKWYNKRRGYGFVRSDDGREFFFHASSLAPRCRSKLSPGMRVRFSVFTGERGPAAEEIDLVAN